MASDDNVNRDSCIYDPNFAIVCSFFEKFSSLCGIKHPAFSDLQQMLDSTDEVCPELIDLHVRLMRKAKKNVNPDRWQRTLAKFCYYYSPQDSWDLEQHGYENLDYKQRLRILLCACEAQFDQNIKFKNDINKLPIDELRLSPIGKDKDGIKYWIHTDEKLDLKIYKENPEEETFDLIATNRDGLIELMEKLKTECDPDRKFEEPIEEEEEDDDDDDEGEEEEEEESEKEMGEQIENQPDIKDEQNADETRSPEQTQSDPSNEVSKKESHSQEAISNQPLSQAQSTDKVSPAKQAETPNVVTPDASKAIKKHVDVKTKRFDKSPEIVLKKEKVVDKTPKVIKAEEFAQHIEKLKSEKMLLPLLNSPLPFKEPLKGNGNETLKTKINMKFNMIKPVLQNEVLMSRIEEVKNKDLYKKVVVKRDDNPVNNYVMQINKNKEAAGKVGKPGLKLEQILKSKLAQKLAAHEPAESKVDPKQSDQSVKTDIPEKTESAINEGESSQPNPSTVPEGDTTKRKHSAEQDVETKKLKLYETVSTQPTPIDQAPPLDDADREIEEPLMLVTGVGSGKQCEAYPDYDSDSDDEREFTLFVTGVGNGNECDTGNNDAEETDKEKHAAFTHKVEDILSKNETDSEPASASTSDDLAKKPEEGEKKKPKLWTIDAICNSDSKESSKKDDISCFPNYSFNKDKKPETAYREYSFFGMAGESKENDVVPTNFYFGCDTQNPPFITDTRNVNSFKEKKTHNVKDIVQLDGDKEKNDVDYSASFTNSKPEEAFNLCMRQSTSSPTKQNSSEAINYSKPSADNVYSSVMSLSASSEPEVTQNQNHSKPDVPVSNSFSSLVPYDDDDDEDDDEQTNDSLIEPDKNANDQIIESDNQTKIISSENSSNTVDSNFENKISENVAEPANKEEIAEDLSQSDHKDEAPQHPARNDENDETANHLSPNDQNEKVPEHLPESDEASEKLSQNDRNDEVPENLLQNDRNDEAPEDPVANDGSDEMAEDLSQNDLDQKPPEVNVEITDSVPQQASNIVEQSLSENKEEPKAVNEATVVQPVEPEVPKDDLVDSKIQSEIPVVEKTDELNAPEDLQTPADPIEEKNAAETDVKDQTFASEPQSLLESVENAEPEVAKTDPFIEQQLDSESLPSEEPLKPENADAPLSPKLIDDQSLPDVNTEAESNDMVESMAEDLTTSLPQPATESVESPPTEVEEPDPVVCESVVEKPVEVIPQSLPTDQQCTKETEISEPQNDVDIQQPQVEPQTDEPEIEKPLDSEQATDLSTSKTEETDWPEPPVAESNIAQIAPPTDAIKIDIAEPEPTQSKPESDQKESSIVEQTVSPEVKSTDTDPQVPSEEIEQSKSPVQQPPPVDEASQQTDEQKPPPENVFSDDDAGPPDAPKSPDRSSEDDADKTEPLDKPDQSAQTLEPSDNKSKTSETAEQSGPALTLRSSGRVTRSVKKDDPSPKKAAKKQPKEKKSKKLQPQEESEPAEPVKPVKKTRGRKKKAPKTPVKSTTPKTQSDDSSDDESNDEADNENKRAKGSIKLNIKKVEKKSEDEEPERDAEAETETDKKPEKPAKTAPTKKKTSKKGWLNEIDVSNIEPPTATPIRQSRRIAQLKIKEQAEGKYIEQITPAKKSAKADSKSKQQVSAKKNNKTPTKKSSKTKIAKEESDGEDSNYEKSSSKKKRKKKDQKKKFKMGDPWKAGSDSSTEEDAEEEDHFEDEEEDEDIAIDDASDHEFSPESDLEDEDFEPVKRARTAHSKPKTEDKAERDDLCCQKCRTAEQPEWILLCDKCDDGWHAACLRPPLMTIPEGDWYCPPCQHNMLISSLHKFLKSYDKDVKKRDNEVLRKKRLEYVGISFSNIISEQQKSEKTDAKVKKEDEEFVKYDISEDDNTEEESEEEPLYTLRVRRQANVSYRLNEYDELMNSAIQTEANGEPVDEGEQNVTATESLAKSDETSVPEKPTEPEESTEQPSEEKDDKDESSEDDDEEEEDESPVKSKEEKVSPMILQLKGIRKKAARLTKLDVSSDDDHYSDEDFKGSSGEDYDEDEYAKSESDSDNARYRKSNRGPVRRSTRARVTRYDNDFINDDDSEEEDYEPKKKKKRSRNSDSDSEEEDSTWGKRKRSKYSRAHRSSSSKKKRKRIVFDGDSDEEKKERKEKKGKKSRVTYGLEESEDDHPQRRTRGKKINYLENLGSDSDDDNTKSASKSKKVVSDDDDYVNEDEEQETGAENAINENGDQSESSVGAISKKSRRKENDVSEKSSELGKSASSLHELIAANNTSVIRTYSKGSNAENVRIQKSASASEPAVPEMDVESKPNDVSAPDKGKKGKKSPKKDVQMYSGVAKGDNKLILKKVDPTNPSLEGMQSMAQSIPQMISSPSSYSMARKMMPPMAGDGQFGPNMGGPAAAGNPPSYSEVGIVYEEADGQMGPDGDKYAHPLRVVSPNKLYGQDGQPIPPIPPMMGRPAPPYMMGPGMPARPMMPGMPPNMMARGVMPMPPGMHLRGPPPGAMPPNAMPPGAMPPNAMPPGAMPPNAMPSGVMPPNALPPNAMPPGGMPPNVMQSGAMPPNLMPPNTMAPNIMPPMSQAPIMAANVAVPSGPNPMAEPSGESPKRRARGRGKKQLEIERLKRESMNPNVQGDEMMPLHMLKPHPSDMNAVRPPPTSSFNSPSPPTPFANYPNMPRLPYSTAGPPASTTQPPSTQSAVTVTVGNPSKRVKITPTRMRQPSPAQNVMRFPRPPSSMMHGAGHLPLDPSPSGGSAVPVNNGDNSMPPRSQPSPNGTPPRTESNVKKEPPMEQYYQPTSYAQASQVPRAFNPRPEFAFAQKPLPPAMYPHPIPSTAAPPTVINRPTTVTTSTVITGPISSQGPLPAGVGKPDVPGTPYPAPYPMNAPPSTISSPTSKSNLTPSSTAAVTTPTSAYQALHIKQLPTAQSAAPAVPYGGPYIVPNSYPPQSHTTPPFSRVPSSAQPSFAKSPQPLSTASPTIPYAASTDTTSNTSSAEYAPPATVGAAPTSDAGFQFQECDTAVASGNEADSGTQFQAGYDEENAASEDQPSGEFGGLVSYFSSQREDDLDA